MRLRSVYTRFVAIKMSAILVSDFEVHHGLDPLDIAKFIVKPFRPFGGCLVNRII